MSISTLTSLDLVYCVAETLSDLIEKLDNANYPISNTDDESLKTAMVQFQKIIDDNGFKLGDPLTLENHNAAMFFLDKNTVYCAPKEQHPDLLTVHELLDQAGIIGMRQASMLSRLLG